LSDDAGFRIACIPNKIGGRGIVSFIIYVVGRNTVLEYIQELYDQRLQEVSSAIRGLSAPRDMLVKNDLQLTLVILLHNKANMFGVQRIAYFITTTQDRLPQTKNRVISV
jgi:hypothetical protein